MPGFIVAMYPPNDAPAEYMPDGFGFTSHAHTLDKGEAEVFPDRARAERRAMNYRFPPAFWESERRHRDAMEKRFRGWRFEIENA